MVFFFGIRKNICVTSLCAYISIFFYQTKRKSVGSKNGGCWFWEGFKKKPEKEKKTKKELTDEVEIFHKKKEKEMWPFYCSPVGGEKNETEKKTKSIFFPTLLMVRSFPPIAQSFLFFVVFPLPPFFLYVLGSIEISSTISTTFFCYCFLY